VRPLRRRASATALTLGLILGAGACAAPGAPQATVPGGEGPAPAAPVPDRPAATVRAALGRDPASLDPRHVADDEGELVVRALFDGLVDIAPDGSVVPAAATWTVEDDGLTFRFALRDDRFHDGSTVTAQHHADALLAVLAPERAPRFREDLLASVRGAATTEPGTWGTPDDVLAAGGIEVTGPRELVVRLARPDPLLLFRLTDPVLVPLPSQARTDPERFALQPVGNGPFRMLGPREPGAFIRLGVNPAHPRPPAISELVLQIYPADTDRSQRWADLQSGRLQIAAIPPERRDEARERFGSPRPGRQGPGLHDQPGASLYAYAFVIDVSPYDRPELRRAISAAIDRETIARDLAGAGVEPAVAIIPPGFGGSLPDCAHCRFEPDLARELIATWRASLPAGSVEPRITLTYPRGGGHVTVAERVASDIERTLDLEVQLQARDLGTLVRVVTAGEAPLFRYGLRATFGGRAAALSLLDPALRPGRPENWTGWDDARTTVLLDGWTPGATIDDLRSIEADVLSAAAVVPILWTRPDLVVHPDVRGFRLDPTGRWWPELLRLG